MSVTEGPPSQSPAPQGQDTVFLRKASGVIRTMSSRDAMYYGYLAATGLYALIVFLFVGAADFPRANIWIANILALAIFLAVYVVYANLSSAMPRSGGDYVFQSRLLRPSIGFTVTWGTWILWGFFYVFMAASAILSAFISPLLSAIGVATGVHAWTTAASTVTDWYVKIPIIFGLILLSTWVMLAGMRPYLRIQRVVMMPLAIGGVVLLLVTYVAFSHKTFINHFNSFQGRVGGLPAQDVIAKAHTLGFRATQSGWFDTLAFAVGLAGFYVWTTWSAELLGEIKQASQLRTSFTMYAGAGILQQLAAVNVMVDREPSNCTGWIVGLPRCIYSVLHPISEPHIRCRTLPVLLGAHCPEPVQPNTVLVKTASGDVIRSCASRLVWRG